MKELDLKILENGHSTGLSIRYGGFLAEAASVCLNHHQHPENISFKVKGTIVESYNLLRLAIDESSINSHADLADAVENGAMGIAIMLMHNQKGYKVMRSWKGTGFDFWVGQQEDGYPFQNKLRMEVSGDLTGTDAELEYRLKVKLKQTNRSATIGLPAYAVIVEFSNPKILTGAI